jgi:hypothetical protein
MRGEALRNDDEPDRLRGPEDGESCSTAPVCGWEQRPRRVARPAMTIVGTLPALRRQQIEAMSPRRVLEPGTTPPHAGKLSVQARSVLEALARTGDGQLTVDEVLDHVRQPGTLLTVARASLSRTPRRLFRSGWVELANAYKVTERCGSARARTPNGKQPQT